MVLTDISLNNELYQISYENIASLYEFPSSKIVIFRQGIVKTSDLSFTTDCAISGKWTPFTILVIYFPR